MIKYGDKVRVKEGFYEGQTGIAIDAMPTPDNYPGVPYDTRVIEVEITSYLTFGSHTFNKKFKEDELEKMEE